MFFLLRVAFWLSIVIMLLPTNVPQQGPAQQVKATDAISAASAAVSDLGQFCGRQPEACAVGTQAATAFGYKAQAGAKMLYEFITERLAPTATGSISADRRAVPSTPSQDTLTPADLTPAWRGTAPQDDSRHAT